MRRIETGELRVLFVDDSEPELLADGPDIDDVQFDVDAVGTVETALSTLEETGYDCIVSEYELADRDGIELLHAVRERYPAVPFILFTDAGSETVASRAISADVTEYIPKQGDTEDTTRLATRIRDAVRRCRAEQARRRTLDAFEYAQEGIAVLDREGRFVYANEAYADIYGYDSEEMLGEHWQLVYPDEADSVAHAEILPTVADEGYWRGETTGLRADGTTFPKDQVVARTPHGDFVCTVREVSDQREPRAELRVKTRAMDEAPIGITLSDPSQDDNPLVYANERFEEVTGYDQAEVVGRNCRFLQGENTAPEPVARMREAIDAQESVSAELRNYRKDGTEFWNRVRIAPIENEAGEVDAYVGFQEPVTERKERKRRLRAIFNNTYTFVGLLEPDGTVLEANDTALSFGDVDRDAVVGKPLWETYWFQSNEDARTTARQAVETARNGDLVRTEVEVQGSEQEAVIDFSVRPVTNEEGEVTLLVPEGRDITERKEYEQQLTALNESTNEFVHASTVVEATEHILSAMVDVADLPSAAVYLYDEDDGVLVPAAQSRDVNRLFGTPPTIGPGEGVAWRVFATGETARYDDVTDTDEVYNPETPIRSELIVSLGEHGVLIAGDTRPGVFDDRNQELAEILAAAAEAALDSLTQTERLRERTQELDRQARRLDRINQLNDAIRSINRTIVDADARDPIFETVCDRMTDLDVVEFAWVGEPSSGLETLSLSAWAGPGRTYLDAREFPFDIREETEPAASAARNADAAHVPNLVRADDTGRWVTAALQQGYKSVLSVPLVYDESLYGVVTIYAGTQDVFDESFREVLAELGELVGLGLNALDRRDALLGRRHTTVELTVEATLSNDEPFLQLAERLDSVVEVSTIVPRDDGAVVYATMTDVTRNEVTRTVDALPGIDSVRRIRGTDPCESDPCLFEFRAMQAGFASLLADHGIRSHTVTFERGQGRILATVPSTVTPSVLVENLRTQQLDVTLESTEVQRDVVDGSNAFLLTDELTAAQQEAVEIAHEAGFFEWPRDSTGEEVATVLGISQPAFAQRLRAAQAKIFGAYCQKNRLHGPVSSSVTE